MAPTAITVQEFNSSDTHSSPDLRILHFNDVYHAMPGSRDPVGGIARFQTLCDHYRNDEQFDGQPELLTFFSGDAFNPSLESSVTKGSHMVPILNNVGVDCACVGVRSISMYVRIVNTWLMRSIRIMTLTLAFLNFRGWSSNAPFPGFSPISIVQMVRPR